MSKLWDYDDGGDDDNDDDEDDEDDNDDECDHILPTAGQTAMQCPPPL